MIRLDLKTKSFGGEVILKDISFEVGQGECLAILGPSGIGKTTVMRMVAGLDTRFDGTAQCGEPKSMVFQEPTLLPWRTVFQNIALIHPDLNADQVKKALTRVGLDHREDHFPGQLSLGQQRRLALARAFAGKPKALFLDEPFVSLDSGLADEMMTLTETLMAQDKPAVLFVTHDKSEAARLATHSVELTGSPATLKGNHP